MRLSGILLFVIGLPSAWAQVDGEAVYRQWCAICHEGQVEKAPHTGSLRNMPPDLFMASLTRGAMLLQAQMLSVAERDAVAEYVVGAAVYETPLAEVQQCTGSAEPGRAELLRWGNALDNTREYPVDLAGIDSSAIDALQPAWNFVIPSANRARSQPAVAAGLVLTGAQDGTVYALDEQSGCVRWRYRAQAEVRTGISVDSADAAERRAYFGDFLGRVYAVDLESGEEKWRVAPEAHGTATITGQPQLFDGVLYVPISSREFLAGASPDYPCCTFRGSVVALDAESGETLWQSYTIPESPEPVGENAIGIPRFAPSGAPVWNTPTIDPGRRLLYVGTGENYTRPTTLTSDAILAIELDGGAIRWIRQTVADDAWNVACTDAWPDKTNCPEPGGPDLDYGAPPVLVRLADGRDILVAGQKSGVVHGIDPDTGDLLWNTRVGRGGGQGGIHFGLAASAGRVFAGVHDFDFSDSEYPPSPGLYALDASTGEVLWSVPADDVCNEAPGCWRGISAPVSVVGDVVFAGHGDGRIRAHAANDGQLLWEYQTDRQWVTADGRNGEGGSIGGGAGPVAVNGTLYVSSGYGTFKHKAGNVLIAFRPESTD